MKKVLGIMLSVILILSFTLQVAAFKSVAVKGIKLDKSKITLNVGQTYTLKVTLTPSNTTQKSLTFATSNKKIATIDAKGKIKAVGKGNATITVYTLNKKLLAKCSVTVSQPPVYKPYVPVDEKLYPANTTWKMLKAKNAKQINITMWIPNSATSSMGATIGELADKYNAEQAKKYPGRSITVTVEYQGTSGALNTKLQAAILAGNNPVITAVGVSSVPLYESKAIDMRRVFTYAEIQGWNQGLLQYSLYNDKFMLNPYFASASNILVANKTLITSSGFMLPTPQSIISDPANSKWTWDEFKRIAAGVTRIDKADDSKSIYGFATGSVDPIGMMFQQGGKLYNDTVTALEFHMDDKIKTGLDFWRSLVTDGAMRNPNSRANHNTIINSEFYSGNVGMIFTTSSNLVEMTAKAKETGFDIEVLPFPKKTAFYTNQGGSGIILLDNKPQDEIEAGADFLKWLNRPENVAHMCALSGYLPINTKAASEPELVKVYKETPSLKTVGEYMKFGQRSPQGLAKAAVDKKVNDYAKQIWSQPKKSIISIIDQLVNEATYEIEANQ